MKKFLSVLALVAAVCTFAVAQEVTPVTLAPKQTSGAKIKFETETVDYGNIEQGADPYRLFKFKNTGTEPLVIKNAKGSCGCTVPTYPKEPILPGASSEIKVRYDTNRVGPFTKVVTLTTNINEEEIRLTIKGDVKAKPEQPAGVPQKEGSLFNGN